MNHTKKPLYNKYNVHLFFFVMTDLLVAAAAATAASAVDIRAPIFIAPAPLAKALVDYVSSDSEAPTEAAATLHADATTGISTGSSSDSDDDDGAAVAAAAGIDAVDGEEDDDEEEEPAAAGPLHTAHEISLFSRPLPPLPFSLAPPELTVREIGTVLHITRDAGSWREANGGIASGGGTSRRSRGGKGARIGKTTSTGAPDVINDPPPTASAASSSNSDCLLPDVCAETVATAPNSVEVDKEEEPKASETVPASTPLYDDMVSVVIQARVGAPTVDEKSLLCLQCDGGSGSARRPVLGRVEEVFGPVTAPLYLVRARVRRAQASQEETAAAVAASEAAVQRLAAARAAASPAAIAAAAALGEAPPQPERKPVVHCPSLVQHGDIAPGAAVFAVDSEAHFVSLTSVLAANPKGCDASNFYDEELPVEQQECSDDEAEGGGRRVGSSSGGVGGGVGGADTGDGAARKRPRGGRGDAYAPAPAPGPASQPPLLPTQVPPVQFLPPPWAGAGYPSPQHFAPPPHAAAAAAAMPVYMQAQMQAQMQYMFMMQRQAAWQQSWQQAQQQAQQQPQQQPQQRPQQQPQHQPPR